MADYQYFPSFPLGPDKTEYELLTKDYVRTEKMGDQEFLVIQPEGLTFLAEKAFHNVAFFLRPEHNDKVAAIYMTRSGFPAEH